METIFFALLQPLGFSPLIFTSLLDAAVILQQGDFEEIFYQLTRIDLKISSIKI